MYDLKFIIVYNNFLVAMVTVKFPFAKVKIHCCYGNSLTIIIRNLISTVAKARKQFSFKSKASGCYSNFMRAIIVCSLRFILLLW